MERWQGVISAEDVAHLYNDKLGHWLLLEVITMGKNGKAEEFKLIAYDRKKKHLHDLMDEDDWDWNRKYIFVFADPNTLCEL
jgi:hypothetical protein